ncbi:MAG TPA: hypothetical protein VK134_01315 [Ktedonobacteraceae bacterium]|nr:hypothetical protein [Ktedonobacteraceae bacterium]
MDIQLYTIHVVPFVIIVYAIFVLFIRPTRAVWLASLAGGLVMALINALIDLLAYYASWWHYTASGLILRLPLPFYLTPMLIYGGVVYMLIWRFSLGPQQRSRRWLVWIFLIGVPLIGFGRDLLDVVVTNSSYLVWSSALAGPIDFVLWLGMFFAGYAVFRTMTRRSQPAPV